MRGDLRGKMFAKTETVTNAGTETWDFPDATAMFACESEFISLSCHAHSSRPIPLRFHRTLHFNVAHAHALAACR